MVFERELDLLIRSSYPIIYVPSPEEERADILIETVSQEGTPPRSVHVWDYINGFASGIGRANPVQALEEVRKARADEPALFVMRDFHRFLDDVQVSRKLRNLVRDLRASRKTLIILAPTLHISPDLAEEITVLDLAPPTPDEVHAELEAILEQVPNRLSTGSRDALVKACLGLMMNRIRLGLARAVASYSRIDERAIPLMLEEKKQRIRQTEVLEFWPATETIDDIGGLDLLKRWLEQRAAAFTQEAREYGLPNPKGILLVGIQGTGKSLSAEATAPCVLFLDELDKGFAGLGSGFVGDSGTSARVLSTILTWMEEKTSPVFIAATANSLEMLPSEVLRKGRFDEIFFIDLPSERERREIFEVHLGKVRPNRLRDFDLDSLAFQSEGFNGAEIEQAVFDAMHRAFDERREFTTDDILHALSAIVPLSKTARERILQLQEWAASGRCRPASSDAAQAGMMGQLFGDASLAR